MNQTQPPRAGNRDAGMAPHGVFRCAGHQRWVAIAARDDADWRRLAEAIGQPELGNDPHYATLASRKENEDTLEQLLTDWTTQRSPEDITQILQAAGVPAFTTYTNKDLSEDPHLQQADFFAYLQHPEVGPLQHIGIPWRMSNTRCAVRHPAPCLGEHTERVLSDILNYSADEIAKLKSEGVLS